MNEEIQERTREKEHQTEVEKAKQREETASKEDKQKGTNETVVPLGPRQHDDSPVTGNRGRIAGRRIMRHGCCRRRRCGENFNTTQRRSTLRV